MYDRLRKRLDSGRSDEGFTLIELLIVIVILGVLAGIVVFAVGGITSRGDAAACKSDMKSVEVAQEASKAQSGNYLASTTALVTAKFLKSAPPTAVSSTSKYAISTEATDGTVSVTTGSGTSAATASGNAGLALCNALG